MRCACSRSQRYFGKLSHDELHPRQSEVAVSAFPLLYSVSDNIAPEIGQTTPSVALYQARYLKLQDCNTCEQPACWLISSVVIGRCNAGSPATTFFQVNALQAR